MEPQALVGRDAELAQVAERLADARTVAVIGEAGIGKTTLVRAAVQACGLTAHEGGGLQTLAWTPLLALRRAVGDGLQGDPTEVVTEVERRVGPDVLFIDDLQWTDHETRQILGLLAGRVALVVTVRTDDADTAAAVDVLRAWDAEVVELSGVDRDAAMAIVRRARPLIAVGAAEGLVAEAGGNPLLLEELATQGRPTSSLARALATRLAQLSPAARRSFELLAVAGHGLPASTLGGEVDELLATGVAVRADHEIAPRHALLAEAAVAGMTDAVRRRRHARLAVLVTDLGQRARHHAGAGQRAKAARLAQLAADAATMVTERATHLELVARMTDGPDAARASLAAARLLVDLAGGASVRAIELLANVHEGTPEVLVERDTLLARASWETGDLAASRAAFLNARGHDAAATSPALAELDIEEARFATNVDGDTTESLRILEAGETAGRRTPHSMSMRAVILAFADGVDTLDALREAYDASKVDPLGSRALSGIAKNLYTVSLVTRGFAAAHAALREAIGVLESRGMPARANELRAEDVQVLVYAGRPADAALLADELLERPLGRRDRQWATSMGALALAWLGRAEESTRALDLIEPSTTDDYQGLGEVLAIRAQIDLLAGRSAEVHAAYEAHQRIPAPTPANQVFPRLADQWAALELGRDPGPAIPRQPWPILAGASLESEGVVALSHGDHTLASRRFRAAADAWTGCHMPREMWCRWAHGEALRHTGAPAAESILRDALQQAEALGLEPVASRARRSLRQAGVYVAPARTARATDGTVRLTGRERQALELVGRGLGTAGIARRMGLGRGTVDQILGAATRKLGAVSRVQAALILERGGHTDSDRRSAPLLVRDDADARGAVLAALEGSVVELDPGTDPALADRVQDDLRRLGQDDGGRVAPAPAITLGPDEQDLLARMVEGMSLGEAAASINISRRTADRRLRAARRAFGVATTAEALVAFQRRGARLPG